MTDYESGRRDALIRLSNAWYGKGVYLYWDDADKLYSEVSRKDMTLEEAFKEFETMLNEEGYNVRINENFNH